MTPLYFDLAPYLERYAGNCISIRKLILIELLEEQFEQRNPFWDRIMEMRSRERNELKKVK